DRESARQKARQAVEEGHEGRPNHPAEDQAEGGRRTVPASAPRASPAPPQTRLSPQRPPSRPRRSPSGDRTSIPASAPDARPVQPPAGAVQTPATMPKT